MYSPCDSLKMSFLRSTIWQRAVLVPDGDVAAVVPAVLVEGGRVDLRLAVVALDHVHAAEAALAAAETGHAGVGDLAVGVHDASVDRVGDQVAHLGNGDELRLHGLDRTAAVVERVEVARQRHAGAAAGLRGAEALQDVGST